MLTLWTSLVSMPRWAHGLIAAGIAIAAFLAWDWFDDRAAVREHERRIKVELNTKDAKGRADASEAARDTKTRIDADTQRGIAAASGSADPLAEAFRQW